MLSEDRKSGYKLYVTAGWAAFFLFAATFAGVSGDSLQIRRTGSWAASQQLVEAGNALAAEDLRDATLRQIVHLSLGGGELRLRLSNRFGDSPLHITAVHVARPLTPDSSKIDSHTDKALTFSGSPDVIVPAHADFVSDPVAYAGKPLSDIAITLHLDVAPREQTGHPGSRATSYVTHGDLVSASEMAGAKTVDHWYFIAGIDVVAPAGAGAIAILGDSITDGHGTTTNGNDRWTDVLARRLQSQPGTSNCGILNAGIGGNRLLTDGLGPNALSRFDQDVIAQPGVRYLIVLEGINDIGMLEHEGEVGRAAHDAMVRRMIAAYEQTVARAHIHEIKVIGGTIMPFLGSPYYHPGPASEADRQAVNQWIREPGHFDAVIDFDKVVRDPEHPGRLLPAFDSGDHLHPSVAGYAAMAEAVPLSLFGDAAQLKARTTLASKPDSYSGGVDRCGFRLHLAFFVLHCSAALRGGERLTSCFSSLNSTPRAIERSCSF
jgi:lysophospholipase L1-like esterase